ncbi:MAG TPA: efflux RND transporter permease subunit [Pirellulales bacterium]|nr:efflux RND transporter permease subunit [Pirellulales bacterium]
MNGLIRASLKNPYAVTVTVLTLLVLGGLCVTQIAVDILPIFKSPAVQVLTFYGGMPAASVEKDITNRMERWTGQAAGTARQESRSIVGASIIRNYYREDIDPNGALTQVNSLASAAIPNLPPGTLPPVILPFDPTSTVPACLVALDGHGKESEAYMYDVGRYEVRNFIMASPGAVAPVVYGGKIRAVLAYLDRAKLQARNLSPVDVMNALDQYNIFLPTGDAKFGDTDYAIDSNSMYDFVDRMKDIPLRTQIGHATSYLGDVAVPTDAAFIQTNIVRVNGSKQVYIPVYRQLGSSTLDVVNNLKKAVPHMKPRLSRPDIDLKVVMDQSVYVQHSIESLAEEGILGAILCSLVILVFLGEWRMTLIAVMTIPISVLTAIIALYYTGNTINVMTLAGLSLAIGPLVDSAIICLENTHRHLGMGASPKEAAFLGASEVAMPELVASCCTLLVLSPLAMMPGMGQFLFKPMASAVAFAMIAAYLLSRSFVPARCAGWLRGHGHAGEAHGGSSHEREHAHAAAGTAERRGPIGRAFAKWEAAMEMGIAWYVRRLNRVLEHRVLTVGAAVVLLVAVVVGLGSQLKREFFPEVDAGAFEMTVRAPSGTRIEITERKIAAVEEFIKKTIEEYDNEGRTAAQHAPDNAQVAEQKAGGHGEAEGSLDTIISEIGVTPDWSAAYTQNSGPMDAIIKVQLTEHRKHSAQEYTSRLRQGILDDPRFADLDVAFDTGGLIRGAMNEGKSTPINIRIEAKDLEKARAVAESIEREVSHVQGVVDLRIMQRLDYPQYIVDVDRKKAADLGLNQRDVMSNVVAAFNSSIQFNKKNFWIDPVSHNQYFVGVQYPEGDIQSMETLKNIPITSPVQSKPVPLGNLINFRQTKVPAEIVHNNLAPSIDLVMGVEGRDLGHVSDDVYQIVKRFGEPRADQRDAWTPYDPAQPDKKAPIKGARILLSGEYSRMQDTFRNLGFGLILAVLLIYFLMVALFKSYITPLVVLSAVPVGGVGVVVMLYVTGTPINVQSLLGVIFMVGIVVSNTVLLTDFAQNLRVLEGLTPTEAIRKAASIRVKPVVMTALAAFFALIPMAMAIERGSEANAPLGRAVIGGLLAGMVTTLFVVPALYSLVVHDSHHDERADEGEPALNV